MKSKNTFLESKSANTAITYYMSHCMYLSWTRVRYIEHATTYDVVVNSSQQNNV